MTDTEMQIIAMIDKAVKRFNEECQAMSKVSWEMERIIWHAKRRKANHPKAIAKLERIRRHFHQYELQEIKRLSDDAVKMVT